MVIRNFEEFKKEKMEWYSPIFHTHIDGYKMSLRIDSKEWHDVISVWIVMMKG